MNEHAAGPEQPARVWEGTNMVRDITASINGFILIAILLPAARAAKVRASTTPVPLLAFRGCRSRLTLEIPTSTLTPSFAKSAVGPSPAVAGSHANCQTEVRPPWNVDGAIPRRAPHRTVGSANVCRDRLAPSYRA